MSINGYNFGARVEAMIAYSYVSLDRSLAGLILFNSESERTSQYTNMVVPGPLKCSNFEGDPEGWRAPDMIPDDCYRKEWMGQTATLCLHREEVGRSWRAISPGSFPALHYLSQFQGSIHQAFATVESVELELVFGMIEAFLGSLICDKYADLASLTAGMNQS